MQYKTIIIIIFSILIVTAKAQSYKKAAIIAGPMPGYTEHTECVIWLQVACAKIITLSYSENGKRWQDKTLGNGNASSCEPFICNFELSGLQMNTSYRYKILLDGVEQQFKYPLIFKTKNLWEWRTDAPDFSFMFGSCNYVNDSIYDRPGKPYGQGTQIFKTMADVQTDFMIWLGDNVYYREADYSSESGMKYRYFHTRKEPDMQKFLASRNHYAIWDDHDFGDDDACKTFEFKDVSRNLFMKYWANKTYGQDGQGIYSSFKWSDAEFFMLDDRWFRDESLLDEVNYFHKSMLGRQQLDWLFNSLKHSKSTFKFICFGGQFLNTQTEKESHNIYQRERAEILKFISEQKINGVVFISGDRHHTELLKYTHKMHDYYSKKTGKKDYEFNYPLYDITSSAISAGSSKIINTAEERNPNRVPNTLVVDNNFCTISVSGAKDQRIVLIKCYNQKSDIKWTYSIKESELRRK